MARGELVYDDDEDSTQAADDDELDELLAQVGLYREGPTRRQAQGEAAQPFHVWPEHVAVLALWREVQTQWRAGPAGITGLDYAGVQAYMGIAGLGNARRRKALFEDLQVMERATLAVWEERRKETAPPKK